MIQNIGSIKRLSKINFPWLIFFISFFCFLLSFLFFKFKGLLSFLVGFFSFSLIFFFLFLTMQNYLKGKEIEDKFSEKIIAGMGISCSAKRVFSYIIVLILLLFLIHFDLFFLYTYIGGIFLSLFITLMIIKKRYLK